MKLKLLAMQRSLPLLLIRIALPVQAAPDEGPAPASTAAVVAQVDAPQPTGPSALTTSDAPSTNRQTLDQVTVTASKKTQVLLDVPYAVTAIGAQEIQDRGVRDLRDMQSVVPSLFITNNSPGMTRIQLRGLSSAQGLPVVSTLLDEVTLDQGYAQRSIEVPLVDMQRVEVLRGPQGTLYGAGALGGAIRFITANPKLDATTVSVEGGVDHVAGAKDAGYFANAVGNIPLSEGVAGLRIVAGTEDIPGWIRNSFNGATNINDSREQYFRAKGLLRIGPNVDVTLLLSSYRLEADAPNLSNSQRVVLQRVNTPVTDHNIIANLVVNADLGFASLVSSSAYLNRGLTSTADVSALIPVPGGVGYTQDESSRSYSQEIRLNSNMSGPLSYTTGAYYRHLDSTVTTTIPQINSSSSGTQPFNTQEYAVFGEATLALPHDVAASLGLRYYRNHETALRTSAPAASATQDFHATSPRATVLWRYSPEGSLYADVAKGFRSGGFNAFTDNPQTYGPDELWSYEIGHKAVFLGGVVSTEVAAYFNQYRDIQGYLISNVPLPHLIIQNTGRASGPGVDLSFSVRPTDRLTWDVTYGYNDMHYKITNLDRQAGDPLNYVPKHTAGTSLTYRYAWFGTGIPGFARADYQFASKYLLIFRNQVPPVATGDEIRSLNMRVGVEFKHWQAYLEGRNLTNNYAITSPAVGAQATDARPVPRSIGVSARAEF